MAYVELCDVPKYINKQVNKVIQHVKVMGLQRTNLEQVTLLDDCRWVFVFFFNTSAKLKYMDFKALRSRMTPN